MRQVIKESVFPVRIVRTEGKIAHAERLLQPVELQIGLLEPDLVCVSGKGSIILDFGRELHGGVRILAWLVDGGFARVRIRTGESLTECCAELGERGAGNDHTLRDTETVLPFLSDQTFFKTGFRFARVDFLEERALSVKAIVAESEGRDLRPVGSFCCNDERVNKIFDVAVRTLLLNTGDYLWDGIKRDRLVWVGDMHPEIMGIMALFGREEAVDRSIDYCMNHTPLPNWMNKMPTYTAWWLVILYDYWMQNGNTGSLLAKKEYIYGCFLQVSGLVSEDGSLHIPEGGFFDWPSHGYEDEQEGVRALLVLTAECCAKMFPVIGLDPAECNALSERLRRKIGKVESFKQCEAFKVYAGIKRAADSYEFLVKNGAHGMSAFMSYYILSAIADAGHPEKAVELMKEYFGGMLDMGATSFWEDFDLDWTVGSAPIDRFPEAGEHDIHGDFGKHCYIGFRHSLCHGWSCGPVPFLMRKLTGIEPLEAGFGRLRVRPVSGGFTWYEVNYPTPQGIISVRYRDGKFDVSVPEGVTIEP